MVFTVEAPRFTGYSVNQNGTSGKLKFWGTKRLNSWEDGVVQRGLGSCVVPKVIVNLCPRWSPCDIFAGLPAFGTSMHNHKNICMMRWLEFMRGLDSMLLVKLSFFTGACWKHLYVFWGFLYVSLSTGEKNCSSSTSPRQRTGLLWDAPTGGDGDHRRCLLRTNPKKD